MATYWTHGYYAALYLAFFFFAWGQVFLLRSSHYVLCHTHTSDCQEGKGGGAEALTDCNLEWGASILSQPTKAKMMRRSNSSSSIPCVAAVFLACQTGLFPACALLFPSLGFPGQIRNKGGALPNPDMFSRGLHTLLVGRQAVGGQVTPHWPIK